MVTAPPGQGACPPEGPQVADALAGKSPIHPGQIEVINQEFTPSREDAEEAMALIGAFEENARRGAGAFAWRGRWSTCRT